MSSDDRMFDHWDEQRNRKLAEVLRISYDELQQTTWDLDEETSNDGLVYNLIVMFREPSPKHILEKIEGIDENNYVYLEPNALGSEPEDDREWGS